MYQFTDEFTIGTSRFSGLLEYQLKHLQFKTHNTEEINRVKQELGQIK